MFLPLGPHFRFASLIRFRAAALIRFPSRARGDLLESAVWREICKLLNDPRSLQQEDQQVAEAASRSPEIERQRVQLLKLQHGLGRLIDSYAEGVIEKDQFTSRMKQTKARICRALAASGASDRERRMEQSTGSDSCHCPTNRNQSRCGNHCAPFQRTTLLARLPRA